MDVPLRFGAELRRLREDAGMTLKQLAKVTTYSTGHLSKIERGVNPPTMNLAQCCDAYFNAGGRLRRLLSAEIRSAGNRARPARRRVIVTGVGSLIAARMADGGGVGHLGDQDLPPDTLFHEQLHQMKRLGQSLAPAAMLPVLRSQASTVTTLASRATGSSRTGLLITASRFAEYIGWMAQESGDEAAALHATAEAVELARAGGDTDLADYALVRRALVTYYNGDASRTIALARQAQRSTAPPRVRGLAAQREAQGHALAATKEPAEERWTGRVTSSRPTWTYQPDRCSAPPSSRIRSRWWRGGASTTWVAPSRPPKCWNASAVASPLMH
ncbi:helix-turn-helix transcriptional regulator [Streptomyces microflavus]|uniref:helix-turn-helix domain-containing protein n=1 Tax=Streptomyces microflavus TaxID=1919 RepID=UPI003425A140